jgi:streptogramin lyase
MALLFRVAAVSLLAGFCAASHGQTMQPYHHSGFGARVMGGRQPVSNASILLSEVGNFGRGTSNGLVNAQSDAHGNFTLPAFTCQSPTSQLFITASGGVANGTDYNYHIFLIAMLGACNSLPNTVNINEFSTVAAAYAFGAYMASFSPQQVGTDGLPGSDAYIGVTNSGNLLTQNMVTVVNGSSAPFLTGGHNSPATLNTLADILVACVNSPAPFANCDTLDAAATPPGSGAPQNTLQAIFNISRNPGYNVAAIYHVLSLIPTSFVTPYLPILSAAPNDWTVGLNYRPNDLNGLWSMVIDHNGNLWIANAYGGASGTGSILKFSPTGKELSPSGGYVANGTLNMPVGLAFGINGNLWIANYATNTVVLMNTSGGVAIPPSANDTFLPTSVAADSFNQIWITNYGAPDSTKLGSVYSTVTGGFSYYAGGTIYRLPNKIIADTTVTPNVMWVANSGPGGVTRFNNSGTPETLIAGINLPGGGQGFQRDIALDKNGDVWVTNSDPNPDDAQGGIAKISTLTNAITGPITGGGITPTSLPWGVAVDSNTSVWVANYTSNSVTELDLNGNALSPSTGFTAGGLISGPRGALAIDRSGDVWVLNTANGYSITELVGATYGPVVTPITAGRPRQP